jgi:hypothetical protein
VNRWFDHFTHFFSCVQRDFNHRRWWCICLSNDYLQVNYLLSLLGVFLNLNVWFSSHQCWVLSPFASLSAFCCAQVLTGVLIFWLHNWKSSHPRLLMCLVANSHIVLISVDMKWSGCVFHVDRTAMFGSKCWVAASWPGFLWCHSSTWSLRYFPVTRLLI